MRKAGFFPALDDKFEGSELKGGHSMRKIAFVIAFLTLVLASSLAVAQTIIENPAKPDNPRAGRGVTVKEEMRIEDTGKDLP